MDLLLDPVAAKAAIRARIRAERRRRTDHQRAQDAERIAEVLLELPEVRTAGCLAIYASLPSEPGTGPARQALTGAGVRVLLPVVAPDGHLDWALDTGDLTRPRGPGGPIPTGPRLGRDAITDAHVIVVPALAVDTLGHRLGQGAGYYDRALPLAAASVPVIALVHDEEVLDAAVEPVPAQDHDHPVHAVVTPYRYLRIR